MAKSLEVAASAAGAIQEDQLERVREFTREPILLEGETLDDLAPGTARRRAVDAAVAELDEGRETPSPEWRQHEPHPARAAAAGTAAPARHTTWRSRRR